jgi:hypothetical protein
MNKNAPYEHEPIKGLENFVNLEECVDVEAPVQKSQTQQSIPKVELRFQKLVHRVRGLFQRKWI